MELSNVAINKNTVPGDVSAMNPGGIRMGSPAMTTRGFGTKDFETVADLVHRGIQIASKVQNDSGNATIKSFRETLQSRDYPEIKTLREEVIALAKSFPEVPTYKY